MLHCASPLLRAYFRNTGPFLHVFHRLLAQIAKRFKICHTTGMEITQKQYERISDSFPKQKGNVNHDNLNILNAILYVAKNGCNSLTHPRVTHDKQEIML